MVETMESSKDRLFAEGKVTAGSGRMGGVSVISIGRFSTVRQRTTVCVSRMLNCDVDERQKAGGGYKR